MSRHKKVKIGAVDLNSAITHMLAEYGQVVMDVLDESVEEVARETREDLKAVRTFSAKGHPSGEYSASWVYDKYLNERYKTGRVIHNEDHYRLTHLLESGHSKWLWGRQTGQEVQGYPHIYPISIKAQEHLERAIEKRLNDIDVDKLPDRW